MVSRRCGCVVFDFQVAKMNDQNPERKDSELHIDGPIQYYKVPPNDSKGIDDFWESAGVALILFALFAGGALLIHGF